MIPPYPLLDQSNLTPELLETSIYPNIFFNYYQCHDWSPEMYSLLTWAGFLSVAARSGRSNYVLLPEIQRAYSVLDWNNVKVDKSIARMKARGELKKRGLSLCITRDIGPILEGLDSAHPSNWLRGPYPGLLKELANEQGSDSFGTMTPRVIAVEIRDMVNNTLVGGEVGYSTGAIYTSLSGYFLRHQPEYNHMGKLQLTTLAILLQSSGYHFWNLGHPYMEYKVHLGAKVLKRPLFLERWKYSRDCTPQHPLGILPYEEHLCFELMEKMV